MRRFLYVIFAGLLAALPVVSFVSSSASAASVYDELILRTDTLKLSQEFGPSYESTNYTLTYTDVDALLQEVRTQQTLTQGDESAYFVGETGNNTPAVWDSYDNKNDYAVINRCFASDGFGGFQLCEIRVMWIEEPNEFTANWTEYDILLSSPNIKHQIEIQPNTAQGGYRVYYKQYTEEFHGDFYVASSDKTNQQISIYDNQVSNRNYPIDYEGILFEDAKPGSSENPDGQICPAYQITVTAEGLLRVIYQKNITPFLTGINFIVVNETSEDWQTLGVEVMNDSTNPAGWTDWTGDTLLEPNQHYLMRISHNQQLDSPPWTTQPTVQNVWIEILYNGSTPYTFTTTGCDSQITNPITKEENPYVSIFEKLNLSNDEFGLGSVVTAPLTFIADLPSLASSCSPISLPLPYVSDNISLPCMTPIYQSNFNAILTLYQSLMIGLFGYYAAIKIYGNIKQLKDPKDDQIEVINL